MKGLQALGETAKQRKVSAFKDTDKKEPIYYDNQDLYGLPKTFYSTDFILLLEQAILQDNLHLLSIEQQEYFEKYLRQADTVTGKDTSNKDETLDMTNIPSELKELDTALGTYEENIGDLWI